MDEMIYNDIRRRIENVEWFVDCGKPITTCILIGIPVAKSWKQAEKLFSNRKFQNAMLEFRNDFSEWLSINHKDKSHEWNSIVDQEKAWFIDFLAPKLDIARSEYGVGINLDHGVHWNILCILMEARYAYLDHPFTYFREQILPIYEAGHLPCGWEGGEWPTGHLVIF